MPLVVAHREIIRQFEGTGRAGAGVSIAVPGIVDRGPATAVVMLSTDHVASRLRCQVKVRSLGAMLPLGVIGLAAPGATATVKFMPLHGPVPATPYTPVRAPSGNAWS